MTWESIFGEKIIHADECPHDPTAGVDDTVDCECYVVELYAAIHERQAPVGRESDSTWEIHDAVRCAECPGCGFTFDADHVDDLGPTKGHFSCPVCGVIESGLAADLRAK